MSTPASASGQQDPVRRLRRWTWILLALAFVLLIVTAAILRITPAAVADAVSNLLGAAVAFGVLAYFIVRGEPAYRKVRASWIGAWIILLGAVPAVLVAQHAEQNREAGKAREIVKATAERVTRLDQEYADRLKAAFKGPGWAVLSSDAIVDAAARKEARANLAAAIGVVDDYLGKRARVPEEAAAHILATRAPDRVKQEIVAEIRASAGKEPLSVQMMKGMRAFLGKTGDMIDHLDRNAGVITVREGRVEFSDRAAAEHYNALRAELGALEADLRRLHGAAQPR